MTHPKASADNLNSRQDARKAGVRAPGAWLDLLRTRLDPARGPAPAAMMAAGAQPQAAAVLAPLLERDGALHMILTVRPETLPRHAGQICFPGGRLHEEDPDDAGAALRETQEEIGIDPAHVELLGRWEAHDTVGGFRVTPFAGLVDPAAILRADPREVAEIFTAPFDFLMDPANHRRESREWKGGVRHFTSISWGDYYIWGATAGMLGALARRLNV